VSDDNAIPMPPGVITCGGKPTDGDVAEMWRFNEFLADVAERGQDVVNRDPKWAEYLGLKA
jgi:hypothetical protein